MDVFAYVVKYFIYPLWASKNNLSRLKYLKEYEKSQYFSYDKIKELQWRRLQEILKHAYKNCPFYTKRFQEAGITPLDIKSPKDLLKIPELTKQDIQENLLTIKAKNYDENLLIKDMTGGSTGEPINFFYTKDRLDSREATTIRHNKWAGWDLGDKGVAIWGAVRDIPPSKLLKSKIRNYLLRTPYYLDASSITDEKMFLFSKKIIKFKPRYIIAYANAIKLFAEFIKNNKISGINPKSIICSAEVLLPEDRNLIEDAFDCKVYNRYGCREFGLIASECNHHKGMHINAEGLYLEFIAGGKHAQSGQTGEIIITDLLNYAMPMIRYKIEDVGSPIEGTCSCGRGLPLMNIVEGRVTEFITIPEGKTISGVALATYVITNVEGIRQAKLIQEEINRLEVIIVKGKNYTENSKNMLIQKLRSFVGDEMQIDLNFKDIIPKEISGKHRFSISRIIPHFSKTL